MPKTLPYFKWYPADADTDAHFRAMDDADIGFYIRCLNHAWVNGGIPADAAERARVLRTRKDTADKRWIRVAPCFRPALELGVTLPNADTILCNPRQEVERKLASQISEVRAESAKQRSKSNAKAPLRAYDYVSVSVAEELKLPRKENQGRARRTDFGERFQEWLRPWPRCGSPDAAAQAWISVVLAPEDENGAFAARDRYLASEEVSRKIIMEPARWLYEQARGGWSGKWPVSKETEAAPKDPDLGKDTDAFIAYLRANKRKPEDTTDEEFNLWRQQRHSIASNGSAVYADTKNLRKSS